MEKTVIFCVRRDDMKQNENESKAKINQLKQQQKETKKKKKEIKKEMRELKGENKGGKLASILLFLGLIGAFLLFLIAMIKTDVGGIGTNVLAPVLKDIPGLNMILPSDVIPKKSKESEKEKNKEEDSKTPSATSTPSKTSAPSATPQPSPEPTEEPSSSTVTDEQLKDFADTYSKMEPEQAATVLGTMTGDLHLVAKILETMKAADRAEIMNNMDVYIAAKLTVIMSKDLDNKEK